MPLSLLQVVTNLFQTCYNKLGVHRNRYCKIQPEPELAGTDQVPAGTGIKFINRNGVTPYIKVQCFKIPGYFKIVTLMN